MTSAAETRGSAVLKPKTTKPKVAAEQRKILRQHVFVAIDNGTTLMKATWWSNEKSEAESRPKTTGELKTVRWKNGDNTVRAQVAFINTAGNNGLPTAIFGNEVDDALQKGEVRESDIIRHLKPMVYQENMEKQRKSGAEIARLSGKLDALNLEIESSLEATGEFLDWSSAWDDLHNRSAERELTHAYNELMRPLELYSKQLKWAWRNAARHMSEADPYLGWQNSENNIDFENFPPAGQDVRVALLVPQNCSTEHTKHVLAAAKAAGIPNPNLVFEAGAALVYHLTTRLEQGQEDVINGKTYLMSDIGGGSLDLEARTVLGVSPLRTSEALLVRTKWMGGSLANVHAERLIFNGIKDMRKVVKSMSKTRKQPDFDEEMLAAEAIEQFEVEKKSPPGIQERYLEIRGLPYHPASRLHGLEGITLSQLDMTLIYDTFTSPISSEIVEAIDDVSTEFFFGHGCQVDEVTVVGGGSLNEHVQQKIRSAVGKTTRSPEISFLATSDSERALFQPALGALLLLADEDLAAQTVMGRSYFFVDHKTFRTVPQFFVLKGQAVDKPNYKAVVQAVRTVTLETQEDDGWTLFDIIHHSNSIVKPTRLDRGQIERLSRLPLKYRLTKEDVSTMSVDTSRNWPFSQSYRIGYLIELSFQGNLAIFTIIIPRSGKLGKDSSVGENPIRKEIRFDFRGVFRPIGAGGP